MGQYHKVVNLDKREFLNPHGLGDGLKLREQTDSGPGGTATALIVLLAVSSGRGGGDLTVPDENNTIVGRWGGDRIAIVGDYEEPEDLPNEPLGGYIYKLCIRADSTAEEHLEDAYDMLKYVQDYPERHQNGEVIALGHFIEALKNGDTFTDITEMVGRYMMAEGIAEYTPSSWGGMNRNQPTAMRPDMMVLGTGPVPERGEQSEPERGERPEPERGDVPF